MLPYNLEVVNTEFVNKHPPIENKDVRLMELRDLRSGKMDKDTTLVNIIGYQETDSEDGGWLEPYILLGRQLFHRTLHAPRGYH